MYAEYFKEQVDKIESITNLKKYRMQLWQWKREELQELCRYKKIPNFSKLNKSKLIDLLMRFRTEPTKVNLTNKKSTEFDFDEFMGIKNTLPKE